MVHHTRLAPLVLALLGTAGALGSWGVRLATSVGGGLGDAAGPQRAEQLVLAAAGVGIAAVGAWLCVGTVVCLGDLLRRRPPRRTSLVRPRVVQHALLRACAPALGAAVVCAGGPAAADTGDLGRLDGLPLPDRPAITLPAEPPHTPLGAARTDTSAGGPDAAGVRTERADRTVPRVRTVRPGDCLWTIAADLLAARSPAVRTAGRDVVSPASEIDRAWRRLYAANRSRIGPAPDLVQPGTRLTVPQPLRPSPPPSR